MMYTDCKMGNNGNIQNHLPKNGGNQMVKGVNRRIVEIKNTNSEYFEKCILYVREDMKSMPFDFLTSQAYTFTADLYTDKLQIFANNGVLGKIIGIGVFVFSLIELFIIIFLLLS